MAKTRRKYNTSKRGSEHDEQVKLFNWARLEINLARYPDLETFHSVPNGAPRYGAQQFYYVAEGLTAGIPDVHLPAARAGFIGLWIEMKYGSNSVTDSQIKKRDRLRKQGHYWTVCRTGEEAIIVVKAYLEGANAILEAMQKDG